MEWFELREKICELGECEVCYPIDIFALSREAADLNDADEFNKVLKEFSRHKNAFVRRFLLIAIRFSEYKYLERSRWFISESLDDPDGWVAYDAAWIVKDKGLCSDWDKVKLTRLAKESIDLSEEQLEDMECNDPFEYASKMAGLALRKNFPN